MKASFPLNSLSHGIKAAALLSLFLLLLKVPSAFSESPLDFEKQIRVRNQEIHRLKNERTDALNIINRFKKRETRVLELLGVLNRHIKEIETRLADIKTKIEFTQSSILETQATIEALQSRITEDKHEINQQLRALFYLRKIKSMTINIGVNSFENYFRNQKLLQNSTHLDLQLLKRYSDNLSKEQEEHIRLKQQTTELETLQINEREQKTLLEFEKGQQKTYLSHLREDHSSQIKYLREIQVELERLNDTLYSLELKKENQRKAEAFQGLYRLENSLPKPVKGKLVHRFDQKQSPFYTLFRRGVLVQTRRNAEVQSILAGKVAWSGPFRGYQNLIILDHGKGSFSVYGNLEDVYVSVDEVVDQSALLGTVAFDNVEGKNLFYFEIRYNKRAVDPVRWLKKPIW